MPPEWWQSGGVKKKSGGKVVAPGVVEMTVRMPGWLHEAAGAVVSGRRMRTGAGSMNGLVVEALMRYVAPGSGGPKVRAVEQEAERRRADGGTEEGASLVGRERGGGVRSGAEQEAGGGLASGAAGDVGDRSGDVLAMPGGGGEAARGEGRAGGAAGEGGSNKVAGVGEEEGRAEEVDRWIKRLSGMEGDLADAEIAERLAERRLKPPVWWARGSWAKRVAWMREKLG